MSAVEPTTFKGRPAVCLSNSKLAVTVVTGGGHLAAVRHVDRDLNPLWEPHWPGVDPNLRRLGDPAIYGDTEEGLLLSSITGHNLCLDVFGDQSEGERAIGVPFHGEAGMVVWSVADATTKADEVSVTLRAHLEHTALELQRTFALAAGAEQLAVSTTYRNLIGAERAMGRSEHATIGRAFLEQGPALFACNADRGLTWPDDSDEALPDSFAVNAEFDYPRVPLRTGKTVDWRVYPRQACSGDLCTLRIRPTDRLGWLTAVSNNAGLALAYAWAREDMPWLMTWEENHARGHKPWNRRELTRGMEFGSYALAVGRRRNVAYGKLFDVPTFEWLDAYETKTTRFVLALKPLAAACTEAPALTPRSTGLEAGELDWRISW